MLNVYGLTNCDSTRKALNWLKANGIQHNLIPVSEIKSSQVRKWLKENERILNRQSTTWRSLTDEEKLLADKDPVMLILSKPSLVKRPVIETGASVIAGFNENEYETQLMNLKNKQI